MAKTAVLICEGWQPRDTLAIECGECGGFAKEATATRAEISTQLCGNAWACCIRAFVCRKCGTRTVAHLEAPEMS